MKKEVNKIRFWFGLAMLLLGSILMTQKGVVISIPIVFIIVGVTLIATSGYRLLK